MEIQFARYRRRRRVPAGKSSPATHDVFLRCLARLFVSLRMVVFESSAAIPCVDNFRHHSLASVVHDRNDESYPHLISNTPVSLRRGVVCRAERTAWFPGVRLSRLVCRCGEVRRASPRYLLSISLTQVLLEKWVVASTLFQSFGRRLVPQKFRLQFGFSKLRVSVGISSQIVLKRRFDGDRICSAGWLS